MKRTLLLPVAALLAAAPITAGTLPDGKRSLKANRTYIYHLQPGEADTLAEIFTKGAWYGRLRLNSFRYDWAEEIPNRTKDNWSVGLGGSITLKTAYFHGFGATIDAYTSQNPWHMDHDEIKFLKSGKDTLSRHDVYDKDRYCMNVIAQLYAEYRLGRTSLRYGRQKFETLLTKSNDTKMIPNTFEGLTLTSRDLAKHSIKLAWFTKQKLRDHTTFHDPLTFGDRSFAGLTGEEKLIAAWGNNDDSAMHRGLSYDNYRKSGRDTNHDLQLAEVWSMAVPNLKAMLNYTAVPGVVSSATVEAHYSFNVGSWKIVPGGRYLRQFDNGGGDVGGAALLGLLSPHYSPTSGQKGGYTDPDSLDSWLVAARLDIEPDAPWKIRLGYSHVGDGADIVAPWRGFPTGGFTRVMGQYNWFANTDTWMVRGDFDFGKAGIVEGLTAIFRYGFEDFDESKKVYHTVKERWISLTPSDRKALELGAIWEISKLRGLEARMRLGFVEADERVDGCDPSYSEYRFEMNYLF